jgi:hypothetical protein
MGVTEAFELVEQGGAAATLHPAPRPNRNRKACETHEEGEGTQLNKELGSRRSDRSRPRLDI